MIAFAISSVNVSQAVFTTNHEIAWPHWHARTDQTRFTMAQSFLTVISRK